MQAALTTVTMVSRSNLTSDDSLQYYCNGYSDQHRREVGLEHSTDDFGSKLKRSSTAWRTSEYSSPTTTLSWGLREIFLFLYPSGRGYIIPPNCDGFFFLFFHPLPFVTVYNISKGEPKIICVSSIHQFRLAHTSIQQFS